MHELVISREDLETISRHAVETYPNECCGILVSKAGEPRRDVRAVHRAENIAPDARNRFELNPADHLRIRKLCDQRQQEVIGFYHSHPDYPAHPSSLDSARAWSDYSYLIVSVVNGAVDKITSWRFNGDLRKFEEESIIVREAVGG